MKLKVGASIAMMVGIVIGVAAQGDPRRDGKHEQAVTITGCVRAGIDPGTFMLMNVSTVNLQGRDQPVPTDMRGRDVLYWLSSTKSLKIGDGQNVQVTGTLDLNNVDEGETTVTTNSSKRLNSTTEVKSEGEKVTVKTDTQPDVAPTTSGGTEKSTATETKRIVYRVKVKSVRVQGKCDESRQVGP